MAAELKRFDIKTVESLQAYIRGTIVRARLRDVKEQFQHIVYDLDGPDYRVLWNSKILSTPIVVNVEKHEKILSRQIGNKKEIHKVEISDEEKEDKTITQEDCDKQIDDFHDEDLTESSMQFERSVRENLEERFGKAGEKGNTINGSVMKSDKTLPNESGQLSSRTNKFSSTRDAVESDVAKMSGNCHGETEDSGTFCTAKGSGNAVDTHIVQDREDNVIGKDFEMPKEPRLLQESHCDLKKTDLNKVTQAERNSGNEAPEIAAEHYGIPSGFKIAGSSNDTQNDVTLKSSSFQSYNIDHNGYSGKKSSDDFQNDSFVCHSTPMSSKSTKMSDEELQKHPLLTESWMTEKSFDPVRSDDSSSTSDFSVSELNQRREQISMELLWTKQAIESRKNYLRLKKTLEKDQNLDTG